MERKRKLKDALDRLFSSPRDEASPMETVRPDPEPKPATARAQPAPAAPVVEFKPPPAPAPKPTPPPAPPKPAPVAAPIPVAAPAPKPMQTPDAKPAPAAAEPTAAAQNADLAKAKKEEEAAKEKEAAIIAKPEHHLVVFQLAEQHYAVDIAVVEGIIKMQPITLVPRTPPFVEGVTNLRGTVLPVFDLRKRFGLPAQEHTKDSRIITIQLHGNTAGIIVDAVKEVLRVPEDLIEPPPPIATTADSSYLVGIANVNNRFVILLDLSQILVSEDKVVLPSFSKGAA
jgi:purine-binding chemotaxis protein CheW